MAIYEGKGYVWVQAKGKTIGPKRVETTDKAEISALDKAGWLRIDNPDEVEVKEQVKEDAKDEPVKAKPGRKPKNEPEQTDRNT